MKKGLRLTAACIAMLFILTMTGCGVNHKSPEGVVEALIKEYVAGSEKKVKSCYVQQDKEDDVLQKEITATLKYFQVHEASEVNIKECETLAEKEDYVYVYVIYNLVLKDKQEYPCISTYMVQKDAGETLEDYLQNKVFGGDEGEKMDPDPEDVKGFDEFISRYKAGFAIERAAVDSLKS